MARRKAHRFMFSHCMLMLALVVNLPLMASQVEHIKLPGERRTTVQANDVYEACTELTKNQQVEFSFDADTPLEFNLHYHEQEQTIYPIGKQLTHRYPNTRFTALIEQTYCWMWRNKQQQSIKLGFSIQAAGN